MRVIPSHGADVYHTFSSSELSRERIPKAGEAGSSVPRHRVTDVQPHPKGLKAHVVGSYRRKFYTHSKLLTLGALPGMQVQKLCPIPSNYHVKGK